MAAPPTTNGSRRETATWAIGAAAAGVITSFAAAVQVIQEPIERDLAGVNRRLDEALLASRGARDELRSQMAMAIADVLARSDERRDAIVTQQGQVNTAYGSALGEVAARVARIEADRARLLESTFSRLQRIEDHLNGVDQRLVEVEDQFTRVLRGDAVKPDRFGGPPYPSRDQ